MDALPLSAIVLILTLLALANQLADTLSNYHKSLTGKGLGVLGNGLYSLILFVTLLVPFMPLVMLIWPGLLLRWFSPKQESAAPVIKENTQKQTELRIRIIMTGVIVFLLLYYWLT